MSYLKIAERYEGKLRSNGWYRMLCPFHADSSPSCDINTETGGFKCWSCGAHGWIADLVKKAEKVPYETALQIVQSEGGGEGFVKLGTQGLGRKKQIFLDPTESLEMFMPVGATSKYKTYLDRRGITVDTAQKYDVREGSLLEPIWNNRIIFPIYDLAGNLVSIEGRAIYNDAKIRYHKWKGSKSNEGIFGIELCRKRIKNKRPVCVFMVEGAFDAMSIYQCGEAVIALSSSALTARQISMLRKVWSGPVVAVLDGIKPGTERERERVASQLKKQLIANFKEVHVFEVAEENTDPNDLLLQGELKDFLNEIKEEVNAASKKKKKRKSA